jgi:GH24 family phage-related lysozyme (muramidase)
MANKLVGDKHIPQDTYDAIVSYLYNTGTGALRRKTGEESNFAKYAQAGDWDNAINEMDIVTAGGKRLPGLEKRRRMERDLARKGLYSQLRNKLALK